MTSLAQETQPNDDGIRSDPLDRTTNAIRGRFFSVGSARKASENWQAARVAIVGCGATGSALAGLLARAGVGTLRIIDRDYVEPSNLQRQSLFDEKDAAESLPKAIAAARKIAAFNSRDRD